MKPSSNIAGEVHPRTNRPRTPALLLLGLLLSFVLVSRMNAAQTVLYSTGFEANEGFPVGTALSGYGGWTNSGSGGNGIVTNFFAGMGQQAYIGYASPDGTNDLLNVWRPLNVSLAPTNQTVVRFSVTMAIISSTNGHNDSFRWSIYNTNGHRLISLDFDLSNLLITYGLDDGVGFRSTGYQFTNNALYDLIVTMNLSQNKWMAVLGGVPIADGLNITTVGAPLNVAEVDAVWAVQTPGAAGDNHLVFDNYVITAEEPAASTLALGLVSVSANSSFNFRLQGQQAVRYAIESSTNLTAWSGVVTNSSDSGALDFSDPALASQRYRFYRARQLP
ncbi:MAG: hypothetical protein HY300_07735 [Verrucomicrobia bacterium]|nr:hypothetical protein [Verrucomicrobiota bacterium]